MEQGFFARDTKPVARDLVGCMIIKPPFKARIVETEAYLPDNDPASHAASRKTERNKPMFGPPGHAYVYICYGIHTMFNIVTEKENTPGAVLIRAAEPVSGIEQMKDKRDTETEQDLCDGPGKLCEALSITKQHNEDPLFAGTFHIAERDATPTIQTTSRIGINEGTTRQLRFLDTANQHCSR